MRRVGQARRRDANEKAIVDALARAGADVTQISGKGAPDLLVRFRDRLYAIEVKSPVGKRTPAQEVSKWYIVRGVIDALDLIGVRCTTCPAHQTGRTR